jgi:Ku protein
VRKMACARAASNRKTEPIERFLPAGQIDARYFEKPYYIVPREEIGQESFAVIHDAMSREGVIGLARVVLSSRERLFLVEPMGAGLRGVTLRFSHEVRGAEDYFSEIPQMKLPAEMIKLAQHIIRTKSAEFNPSMLEDHYRSALVRIRAWKPRGVLWLLSRIGLMVRLFAAQTVAPSPRDSYIIDLSILKPLFEDPCGTGARGCRLCSVH